jgi:hypothetical protein
LTGHKLGKGAKQQARPQKKTQNRVLTAHHGGRYEYQNPMQYIAHGFAGENAQNVGKNCGSGQPQRQGADPADLQKKLPVFPGNALDEKQDSRDKKQNGYNHKGSLENAYGGNDVAQRPAEQEKHTPDNVKDCSFHNAPDLLKGFYHCTRFSSP